MFTGKEPYANLIPREAKQLASFKDFLKKDFWQRARWERPKRDWWEDRELGRWESAADGETQENNLPRNWLVIPVTTVYLT